ncbi:DUF58 domain-containing protein [Desulfococcaceae bacterium HSG8]|nr:DUF58 domain-containing protein [Desulfococcaceae bacterium HSG8]
MRQTNSEASFPQTLDRKRIYILPTRHGLLFIIILGTMLAGSLNYNNNLGFLLTFLLGSMAFVSILHTFRNLSGIQVVSVRTTPVFANETAVFEFIVRTTPPARAAVSFSFFKGEESCRELFSNKDNQVRVQIASGQRGRFRPGSLTVSSMYPLGLFRAWSNLRFNLKCTVYPAPLSTVFNPEIGACSDSNNDAEASAGPGVDDFQGLKPYQPGDSLRHISWKAYSRGRGLFTKSFTGGSVSSVFIDWSKFRDTDTERKLSRLCDMVLKANRMNLDYGLKLPGKMIDPGKGEIHKHQCLKILAFFNLPSDEI